MNRLWGPGSKHTVRFSEIVPLPASSSADWTQQTAREQPVEKTPAASRPRGGELLSFSLAMALCIFIASLGIAWASGSGLEDALRTALIVAGVALFVAWAGLAILFIGADLGRSFDHFLIAILRAKEIDADLEVRMAEIDMRRSVSLSQAQLDASRAETARAALAQTTSIPAALTDRDQTEETIVQAVISAYKIAGPDGTLDGSRQCPFGKRAVGDKVYPILLERLANPGTRWGIHGCASIANYDAETKRWTVNLREYPTPDRAVAALCGR